MPNSLEFKFRVIYSLLFSDCNNTTVWWQLRHALFSTLIINKNIFVHIIIKLKRQDEGITHSNVIVFHHILQIHQREKLFGNHFHKYVLSCIIFEYFIRNNLDNLLNRCCKCNYCCSASICELAKICHSTKINMVTANWRYQKYHFTHQTLWCVYHIINKRLVWIIDLQITIKETFLLI